MQPSLILGTRKQWRITEMAGRVIMPLVNPLLLGRYEQWRAIPARTVAAAMRAAARTGRLGRQSPRLAGIRSAGASRWLRARV